MIVRYHKLEKLLKEKKIPKSKFYRDIKLTPGEMAKIRSCKVLSLSSYIKICQYLNCDISDFMDILSVDSEEPDMKIDLSILMKNSYKTPIDKIP